MLRFLKRLFAHLEEWLLGLTLAGMALTTFVQVVARARGRSISFTEEVIKYLLVWITMLGIAAAANRRSHIRVHAVTLLFPRARRAQIVFGSLCSCALFAVLLIFGAKLAWTRHRLLKTSALNWPLWWVGISIPIGAGLALLRTIQACWRGLRSGDADTGPAGENEAR